MVPGPVAGNAKGGARGGAWLAAFGSLALAACGAPEPSGQVVATVGDTDVTLPELDHEAQVRGIALAGASAQVRSDLLEQVIARKILAAAAEKRELNQSRDYHFELRKMREEMLVDALRKDIADSYKDPTPEEIDAYIASRPWRFEKQFVLSMATTNDSGEPVTMQLASRDLPAKPAPELQEARRGATLEIAGTAWRIANREQPRESMEEMRQRAAEQMRDEFVQAQLKDILTQGHNPEAIRYGAGYGPASR